MSHKDILYRATLTVYTTYKHSLYSYMYSFLFANFFDIVFLLCSATESRLLFRLGLKLFIVKAHKRKPVENRMFIESFPCFLNAQSFYSFFSSYFLNSATLFVIHADSFYQFH